MSKIKSEKSRPMPSLYLLRWLCRLPVNIIILPVTLFLWGGGIGEALDSWHLNFYMD